MGDLLLRGAGMRDIEVGPCVAAVCVVEVVTSNSLV
jgi:hypothetical protein